ncbi:MAG: cobalamin biosynthesis protein P47K [Verrucomicrobiales bacterium]|nr:cobalamin biosynthesis protein P47K [Verrucomicrobiales bacterium]
MSILATSTPSRYLMIGGFLGAGKTTSIQKFAQYLSDQGLKVGLITNDQGAGLVDSALGRSNRFPVEEISGGCFCCRFNSLIDAARHLSEKTRPDVFLAEPVGSCTDLVATVSLPLEKIYGEEFVVAPLSVLIDPTRARRVFGLEDSKRKLSDNVRYIYRKQLEEAEIIVINKIDTLAEAELDQLQDFLAKQYPDATIYKISARDGLGLAAWFTATLEAEMNVSRFLEIDYQRYGDGEALLGWLNSTIKITTDNDQDEFDGNQILVELAQNLRTALAKQEVEIAHLKMTLTPLYDPMEIAAINLTRSDAKPELSHHLIDPLEDGELLLNIRAEAAPETLDQAVTHALEYVLTKTHQLKHNITHSEHFRPGMPKPTHRLTGKNKP